MNNEFYGKAAELLKDGKISLQEMIEQYKMPLFDFAKKPYIRWSLPEYRNTGKTPAYLRHKEVTGQFLATGKIEETSNLGIIVIDIDTDDAGYPVGFNNYQHLVDRMVEHNEENKEKLLTTLVKTPSGGFHFYYYYNTDEHELKNSVSVLTPMVDIRAQGGIIVLPGTETEKGVYEIIRDYPIAPLPDYLLDILLNAKKEKILKKIEKNKAKIGSKSFVGRGTGHYESIDEPRFENYRAKVFESILEDARASMEGSRDNDLIALSTKAGSFGIEYELARDSLVEIFTASGLDFAKVDDTFERGYEYGRANLMELEVKESEIQTLKQEQVKDMLNNQEIKKEVLTLESIVDSANNDNIDNNVNHNLDVIMTIEDDLRKETNGKTEEELERERERKRIIENKLIEYVDYLWEEEIYNLYGHYVKETKSYIHWDDKRKVWEENESLGILLRDFRREKKAQIQALCKKERIASNRVTGRMAGSKFLDEGERAVRELKNVSTADINGLGYENYILAENGIIDLSNGNLLENDKKYLYKDKLAANYIPYAELLNNSDYDDAFEKWEKVLSVVDKETLEYLQRVLGGSLTRRASKTLRTFWWYSKGSSGKTTLANIITAVFGSFGSTPKQDVFQVNGNPFELSLLEGKRIGVIEEAPSGFLDAGRLKSVTGADKVGLRNLYEKSRNVKATWHLHLMTNNLPLIRQSEADFGTMRRIVIIPFLKKFTEQNGVEHPLLDIHQEQKVREIALAWLVEGAKEWVNSPDGCESENYYSPEMIKANNEFKNSVIATSDPITNFITECIEKNEDYQLPAQSIFEGYQEWCKINNVTNKKTAQSFYGEFEHKIGLRFEDRIRAKGKKQTRYGDFVTMESLNDKQVKRMFGIKFV